MNYPITPHFHARSNTLEVAQGTAPHGPRAIVDDGASGLGLDTTRVLAGHGRLYLEDGAVAMILAEPDKRISGPAPHIVDPAVAQRLCALSETLQARAGVR